MTISLSSTPHPSAPQPLKPIALWLLANVALIFIMAIIGAVTRLTESGLSMVQWHVVMDMLPPLNPEAWQHQFSLYQQTPEYLKLNHGMSLEDFKSIYFWEWLHRLWGRMLGLTYAIPFVYFLIRRQIPRWLLPNLVFFLFLGGLQGFVGWYMVKSGLIDEPRVSHYRLALHLGMAFIIFALLWRQALQLLYPKLTAPTPLLPASLKTHGVIGLVLASITIVWGVFVAGLDAGMIYNEFPLMGGQIVPAEAWHLSPAWLNLFDNHAMVQFTHRALAIVTFITVFAFGWRCRAIAYTPRIRKLGLWLLVAITTQLALGIITLLTQVSLHAAATHQAGALIVLALLIWQDWELRRYPQP
jgi:cytochrome c oxidase assembly protein subunit 15